MGRKGARPRSSGGVQVFQLLTEESGPWKLHWFMAHGTPGLPGPEVFVQSQRRQRFLTTIVDTTVMLLLKGVWLRGRSVRYKRN